MPDKITIEFYPKMQMTLFSVPDLGIQNAEYNELPSDIVEILECRFGN